MKIGMSSLIIVKIKTEQKISAFDYFSVNRSVKLNFSILGGLAA